MKITFLQISYVNNWYSPGQCDKTMMASDMVEKLQWLIRCHGDMPIFMDCDRQYTFAPIVWDSNVEIVEDYDDDEAGEQWCENYDVEMEEEEEEY